MAEVVLGAREIFARLDAMEKRLRTQVVRKALTAAGQIMLDAARANAPVEIGTDALSEARAGLYKKSLGKKIKTGRGGAVALIGPRRGQGASIGVRQRGRNKGRTVTYDPERIAHLVEKGSRRSKASHVLQRTLESAGPAANAAMIDIIRAGVSG
jgi:HK97 gp10 family phage protein